MPAVENYQNLIIGSGEAGKYLAWSLARAGQRTAVVERKYVGGQCPNVACLPSKNVIYSARVVALARRGPEFGLESDSITTNMQGVQARKRKMVEGLVQMHLERYAASGAELIMGEGRFIAPRTVAVNLNTDGERVIKAERVFLDLGTHAALPDVPGLSEAKPMTHVEALDLERLPDHLVVLGGGYVGLELAQAMRRFGSRVTVIEQAPQLAGREDPDIAAALLDLFRDEGIEVLLRTEVQRVTGHSGQQIELSVDDGTGARVIDGTDLLVGTGRTPNTHGIGLELAAVDLDPRGYLKVNERLETSAPNVWAMGDCAGSPQFTHVSFDDFRIVRDNLSGGNRTTTNRLIPYCMFTDPELARVGLNEVEARTRGIPYRVASLPMAAVLRTRTTSEPRGFMKMLIDVDSDGILGFTVLGDEASELMATVQSAMLGNQPFTMLRDGIFTHPTAAEGLTMLLASVPQVGAVQRSELPTKHITAS
jgi:pyruvate/2-oxoglutarate dehydrogenase complex dihydrolipoamide dehydrogenase (E3) component